MRNLRLQLFISFLLIANGLLFAQQHRKVIINQDCSGPGGSNMQTLLTLIQSPQVDVLGITVVSGNRWRDEEVAHTLRLLELIGRTDYAGRPGSCVSAVRNSFFASASTRFRSSFSRIGDCETHARIKLWGPHCRLKSGPGTTMAFATS